ncbi:MAG TPA: hypothetical protein VEY96_10210, partial [Actinomycetes bacterium]|nr:hypothetical protein [Actinomycetes bacterium]
MVPIWFWLLVGLGCLLFMAALVLWTFGVTIPRDAARLAARTAELRASLTAKGWRSAEPAADDPGEAPWVTELMGALWRHRAPVELTVQGRRAGYDVVGLWTLSSDHEGQDTYASACMVRLPSAYRATVTVRPRLLQRISRHLVGSDGSTGDAGFDREFLVRAEPGWAAGAI